MMGALRTAWNQSAVLIVPLADLSLAVVRRVGRGQSPFAPDKGHLHHRLLELGHSHRRAVGLLYYWTALLAFGGVGFAVNRRPWVVLTLLAIGVVIGCVISGVPRAIGNRLRRRAAARASEPAS